MPQFIFVSILMEQSSFRITPCFQTHSSSSPKQSATHRASSQPPAQPCRAQLTARGLCVFYWSHARPRAWWIIPTAATQPWHLPGDTLDVDKGHLCSTLAPWVHHTGKFYLITQHCQHLQPFSALSFTSGCTAHGSREADTKTALDRQVPTQIKIFR